jgi:CDP-6-deoxy-D-xylo-4-hexulose-3-dehydrase
VRFASLVNSGSSANLLALSALTSRRLKDQRLQPGDEVIVAGAGFPTTLNPVIQNGLTPVFVDVDLETLVPSWAMIQEAIGRKTRAIFLAHTLGNPVPLLHKVAWLREKHDIFVIEDNCDALGSLYRGKRTGTFGAMATQSFYPAHHITTGEGGAVLTSNPNLKKIVESFRDWGRDCWCDPGKENTCGKRFGWNFPNLPSGYDHKYVYSHIGYNLKATDFQAAIGHAQIDRLDEFVQRRYMNFGKLAELLEGYEESLILPRATKESIPCWFGFPITVRDEATFDRDEMVAYLNHHKVGTRNLFGGNLMNQPAYRDAPVRPNQRPLHNSDKIARSTFWIGVWPGIDDRRLNYMLEILDDFLRVR